MHRSSCRKPLATLFPLTAYLFPFTSHLSPPPRRKWARIASPVSLTVSVLVASHCISSCVFVSGHVSRIADLLSGWSHPLFRCIPWLQSFFSCRSSLVLYGRIPHMVHLSLREGIHASYLFSLTADLLTARSHMSCGVPVLRLVSLGCFLVSSTS